jgi:Domain of unknown function (DUF4406)
MVDNMSRKLKVYIAGKITGLPTEIAKRMFDEAAEIIRKAGYIPINPFEIVPKQHEHCWIMCMKYCKSKLIWCDMVYVLPNWKESRGARIEKRDADDLGIQVINDISFFKNKVAA